MKAIIHITLKEGVLDPQGKAINVSLNNMGFEKIEDVRQGKFFEIEKIRAPFDEIQLQLGNGKCFFAG